MHILFLASWYPNDKNPLLGIFIKRHAIAASKFHKVTLLHAAAIEDMKEGEFRISKKEEGSFRELIIYFGKSTSQNKISKFLNQNKLLNKHYLFGAEKLEQWYGKPDLIHLNVPWPIGQIALRLAKRWKTEIVVSEHWTGYHPEDGRYKGLLMKCLTSKVIKKASTVLTVSEQLAEAMKKHGLKGNYEVAPNVVDDDLFKPAKESPEGLNILHVSVIDDQQKNISGLLKAFKKLHNKNPSYQLTIVGGGPDESSIKRLSNELGLTFRGVEFTGSLQGQDLAEAYQKANVLIMNSRYENQPVVILEALMTGIPVIAPNIGGIAEVVHDKNGVLFMPNEESSLINAVETWAKQKTQYIAENIRNEALANYASYAVGEQLSKVYLKASGKC